jgi:hypothetical protein
MRGAQLKQDPDSGLVRSTESWIERTRLPRQPNAMAIEACFQAVTSRNEMALFQKQLGLI